MGTHTNVSSQYSENMVTIMSTTMSSLVASVAVTSMKMFLVSSVILVWSELICTTRGDEVSHGLGDSGARAREQTTHDRRHAEDLAARVIDDRVDGRVLDDVQVARQVLVLLRAGVTRVSERLEECAVGDGVRGLALKSAIMSGAEYSCVLFNGANLISEGGSACVRSVRVSSSRSDEMREGGGTHLVGDVARRDLVEVVGADGDERATASEVLVELVLEVDEAGVVELVEADVAQDGRREVGADLGRLGLDVDGALRALWEMLVAGQLPALGRSGRGEGEERGTHGRSRTQSIGRDAQLGLEVELEGACDALDAQEVVAVGGDLNLELVRLAGGVVRVAEGLRDEVGSGQRWSA